MCGRARCTLRADQVARACGVPSGVASSVPTQQIDRYRPSYNVAPGRYLPVFTVRSEGEVIHCMKWGLVPSFTKKTEKPDHFRMFNARSESIGQKAAFRRLIPNNRCLVAVEGFYEWKKDGSKKQPYYIHFKDHRPLVLAALYDSWLTSEGDVLYTFTILTTRSSSALEWLHDRMPVILGNKDSIDVWLEKTTPKWKTALGPYEDPDLVWFPVTHAIGKLSFDGPECIKEIQLKQTSENPISKFFSRKIEDNSPSEPEDHEQSKELSETNKPDHFKDKYGAKEGNEPVEEMDHKPVSSALVKEEVDADESDELSKTIKGGLPDTISSPVKEESAEETDIPGIKREHEETDADSKQASDEDALSTSPPKKRGKGTKTNGDKQATLLSYFGKR